MEKLNIVWIKKWKIKRNLISVMTKIKAFFEKRNWNYVAIIAIIFGGAVVVYTVGLMIRTEEILLLELEQELLHQH